MLRCYLLALASGSSVDRNSNNFSLFNLIEQVGVPEEVLGLPLPFEVHFYWLTDVAAHDKRFELRVVRIAEDGAEDVGDSVGFHVVPGRRLRIRVSNFRLPKAYGQYKLQVEWRQPGETNWNREAVLWPLSIEPEPAPRDEVAAPAQ